VTGQQWHNRGASPTDWLYKILWCSATKGKAPGGVLPRALGSMDALTGYPHNEDQVAVDLNHQNHDALASLHGSLPFPIVRIAVPPNRD
jgi:hypothetical protein